MWGFDLVCPFPKFLSGVPCTPLVLRGFSQLHGEHSPPPSIWQVPLYLTGTPAAPAASPLSGGGGGALAKGGQGVMRSGGVPGTDPKLP